MSGSSPIDDAQPGSSPDVEANAGAAPVEGAAPEGSSSSFLDKIEGVLNAGKSATPESGQGPEPEGEGPEATATASKDAKAEGEGDEELGPVTDEELRGYHSRTRRRIKSLLEESRTAKQEAETLRPDAEFGRSVRTFVEQQSLDNEDVKLALGIAGLIRNDPFKAVEALSPILQELQRMTGGVISEDMRSQVEQGLLTEQHARALEQSRARETHAAQQTQRMQEQQAAEQRQAQIASHSRSIGDAVTAWDVAWKDKDPDYGLKQPRVQQLIELDLYKNGPPKTPEEALQRVKTAREAVEKDLRQFVPAPQGMKPNTGTASSSTAAKPKTFMEAIDRVLAG